MTFDHDMQSFDAGDPEQIEHTWDERWYHIKTPLKKKGCTMYRYDLRGYAYGEAAPLDLTWVGYNFIDGTFERTSQHNRYEQIMPI